MSKASSSKAIVGRFVAEASASLRRAMAESDENADDAGTTDFLTALIRASGKTAWMLRSHLL